MTQARREVQALSPQLKPMSDKQLAFCTMSTFGTSSAEPDLHRFYHQKSGRGWCTHCAETFYKSELLHGDTCPHCGAKLHAECCNKRVFRNFGYSAVLDTMGDWQIVRYVCTKPETRQGEYDTENSRWEKGKAEFFQFEFMRKWYDTATGLVVTERTATGLCANFLNQPYSMWSDLWVAKSETYWTSEWFRCFVCPHGTIHASLRQRGFNFGRIKRLLSISETMQIVREIPYAETLLKAGEYKLLNAMTDNKDKVLKWKDSIRIALKHGFRFNKVKIRDYVDYLSDLEYIGRDTHSPVYVAPKNLQKAKEAIRPLVERRLEAKRKEEERKKALANKERFEKHIAPFRDLCIIGFGLEIRPLLSFDEFKEEGKKMHHCVAGYYYHNDCLILSARMDGERVETIEISLKDWKIVQSRGLQNKTTPQHDNIISLMNKNMGKIRKLSMAS